MVVRGLRDPYHPLNVQIVPIRRCNLACTYCNEYDRVSPPVPLAEMLARIDRLSELGTSIVTLSGGEPLLHPELDQIIRRIREHDMMAALITNGFFLGTERIQRLNQAGLEYLQISIDNVRPDSVSQKSLKTLDVKLQHLAAHAEFHVNINSVIGAGLGNAEDARTIALRASELGFSTSVGILHNEAGQLEALSPREQQIYEEVAQIGAGLYSRINGFQRNLVQRKPNDWHCRAGARYLYICEEGRVHYCSQRRGEPGVLLQEYTREDIAREFHRKKECAPFCTIGCVHRTSALDNGLDRIEPLLQLRPVSSLLQMIVRRPA